VPLSSSCSVFPSKAPVVDQDGAAVAAPADHGDSEVVLLHVDRAGEQAVPCCRSTAPRTCSASGRTSSRCACAPRPPRSLTLSRPSLRRCARGRCCRKPGASRSSSSGCARRPSFEPLPHACGPRLHAHRRIERAQVVATVFLSEATAVGFQNAPFAGASRRVLSSFVWGARIQRRANAPTQGRAGRCCPAPTPCP
jgi:hypothetical protein